MQGSVRQEPPLAGEPPTAQGAVLDAGMYRPDHERGKRPPRPEHLLAFITVILCSQYETIRDCFAHCSARDPTYCAVRPVRRGKWPAQIFDRHSKQRTASSQAHLFLVTGGLSAMLFPHLHTPRRLFTGVNRGPHGTSLKNSNQPR